MGSDVISMFVTMRMVFSTLWVLSALFRKMNVRMVSDMGLSVKSSVVRLVAAVCRVMGRVMKLNVSYMSVSFSMVF